MIGNQNKTSSRLEFKTEELEVIKLPLKLISASLTLAAEHEQISVLLAAIISKSEEFNVRANDHNKYRFGKRIVIFLMIVV
ncbi:MAG TPA: hypothetical protein VGO09_11880 [Flavisolibacter sp.]|nr:hypothetical protein [Flavisolibacter sp.]